MRLLVDTFNVLHVTGVLPPGLAGPDVAGLAALVASSRWGEAHVALVCDGSPPSGKNPKLPARIRAIYSGTSEADDILERLIQDSSAPGRLLVVSSDRRVRKAARRRGAKNLDASSFLRALLEDRRAGRGRPESIHRPANLRPGEVNQWRDTFKLGSDSITVSDEDLPSHLLKRLQEGSHDRSEEESGDRNRQPRTAPHDSKSADPTPDLASLLPEDLLEEARALLSTDTPTEQTPPPDKKVSSPSERPPTRSDRDLPEDIIRQAEDLLRDPPTET
ncbi:MAG: hypothetical protein CMJ29_05920 [Phycisphaerae bacterium]|nr:hypothetical protein [Phycisphaerae bacterium]|tara:strand:+ start:340 stop:1167 length:828 start_codon:yes stop_codon:yes gene_type:complete